MRTNTGSSAAFSTSIVTTLWDNASTRNHANMVGALNDPAGVQQALVHGGMTSAQALGQIDNLTQSQAVMLATDQMFFLTTIVFVIAALAVWLSPKPNIAGMSMGASH
jgi:DHA2 family multidrug resistance protein